MISNLINNAVEACDRNSGIVDVSLSNEDGKQAKIVVKDNGVGMPQEIIDKITLRYLDFGSTKHSGTGLGLSQILATVDSFKGTLGIESETNVGTSFIIKFPLADCPNWLVKKLEFQREDIVVILDDDPSVLKIFEELLKKISEHISITN